MPTKTAAPKDLYDIAEEVQKADRRFKRVYFEDGHDESLWFDTFPAKLSIFPLKRGRRLKTGETIADANRFSVAFSWEEDAEDMGEYKTARTAVKRAMELALWTDDDIRALFMGPYWHYRP
jgi:hypothetical protein